MFNSRRYDKRTISVLEIIAAYVANLFFSHFYAEAERQKIDRKVQTVTDGYIHVVSVYLSSIKKAEHYKRSILGMHEYYQLTTRFNNISLSECVNDIVRQFVPDEFCASLDTQQKETILHNVFTNAVNNFANEVTAGEVTSSTLLMRIIDNRSDPDTKSVIKQKMMDCLLFERESMYRKFLNRIADPHKRKPGQEMKLSAHLKRDLTDMTRANMKLAKTVDDLRGKLDDAGQLIDEKNKLIRRFQVKLRETYTKLQALAQKRDPIVIGGGSTSTAHPGMGESVRQQPSTVTVAPVEHVEQPATQPAAQSTDNVAQVAPITPVDATATAVASSVTISDTSGSVVESISLVEHVQPSEGMFAFSNMD